MGRREHGQAAVETALTLPMFLFTFLGILQISLAYHARILTEYAAFKAARAGSVYRGDCERMKKAALMALVPSMSTGGKLDSPNLKALLQSTVEEVKDNKSPKDAPIVWIDRELENTGEDFDKQLEPGDDKVQRIRVRVAYFFEYRIPFANQIIVRSWLATQTSAIKWAQSGRDTTMLVVKANDTRVVGGVDDELVDQAKNNYLSHQSYTAPIVASWSMRMMSDPLPNLDYPGKWDCK
ncbi:MAG: pilus assembly protein [Myxococcales bacterium]